MLAAAVHGFESLNQNASKVVLVQLSKTMLMLCMLQVI